MGDADYYEAAKEFTALLQSLEATGLHVEVRPGYEQTILLFIKAPSALLGNRVYKLRYALLEMGLIAPFIVPLISRGN